MSNEKEHKSLEEIMEEIDAEEEAIMSPPLPDPEPDVEEKSIVTRSSQDDIDDRRKKTWELRQRGMTYREIGEETGVSIATVKKDLDVARQTNTTKMLTLEKGEYLAETISQYDDIIQQCWNTAKGADKETKLKSLDLIRRTLNDKRKALQDTGAVKKENKVVEHNITVLDNWTDQNKEEAINALLQAQMPQLEAPTPDIQDAEILEDSSEEDGDSEQ